MDAEDFELAVTAIVRERSFKQKPRKQCVRAIFKEREEKVAKQENFIIQTLLFMTSGKVSSSLQLNYLFSPCS